jgi:hypothetical protein
MHSKLNKHPLSSRSTATNGGVSHTHTHTHTLTCVIATQYTHICSDIYVHIMINKITDLSFMITV